MKRSKTPDARISAQTSKQNLYNLDKYQELEDDFLTQKLKNDFFKEQDYLLSSKKEGDDGQQTLLGDYIDPSLFQKQNSTISDVSTNDTAPNSLTAEKLPISSYNMNINLSNPQQIFNILQMYPQETKIIDLRPSPLQ